MLRSTGPAEQLPEVAAQCSTAILAPVGVVCAELVQLRCTSSQPGAIPGPLSSGPGQHLYSCLPDRSPRVLAGSRS